MFARRREGEVGVCELLVCGEHWLAFHHFENPSESEITRAGGCLAAFHYDN